MAMAGALLGIGVCRRPALLPLVRCVSHQKSVVVTRERGKNHKLIKALQAQDINCFELPLIEHTPGPDLQRLPILLTERPFQWVVVTSPEAAVVFLDGWKNAGYPKVQVAVIGEGTKEVFNGVNNDMLQVGFVPSKATAKVLAKELPKMDHLEVLYPASVKASNDLADGLGERGFKVCRLNTYSSESVKVLEESAVLKALEASVVTFASPTAVKAWRELVLEAHPDWNGVAACIGGTSAEAARKAGIQKVFYADNPGLDGWVQSIMQALNCERGLKEGLIM